MKKILTIIALGILFTGGLAYAKVKFEYLVFKEGTTAILYGGAIQSEIQRFQDGLVTCYIVPTKVNNYLVNQGISCVK